AALAADGTGPRPALHDHARPDGHGRTGELTATLAGWTGAVAPSVPVDPAGPSLQWARRALECVPAAPPPGRASAGSKVSGGDPTGSRESAGRGARCGGMLIRGGGARARAVAARGRVAHRDRGGPPGRPRWRRPGPATSRTRRSG